MATRFRRSSPTAHRRDEAADRRMRGGDTLEFSERDDYPQSRPGACRRLHDGDQACVDDPVFGAGFVLSSPNARAFRRACCRVVTGSAAPIGKELTTNPLVRKFTFTGSTEVGKQLMAQCAWTVKKVSLELGGNAPFIVFDDADLDSAVEGAMASQVPQHRPDVCCANRLFVQDGVYETFARKFSDKVSAMKLATAWRRASSRARSST